MTEPFLFTRAISGLVPDDDRSREALQKMKMGEVVEVTLETEWRPVPGFEPYCVSNLGGVRRGEKILRWHQKWRA